MARPTFPSGTASGFKVRLCRCGEIGEEGSGDSEGFIDDEALECLRSKLMTGPASTERQAGARFSGSDFQLVWGRHSRSSALETQCPRSILQPGQRTLLLRRTHSVSKRTMNMST